MALEDLIKSLNEQQREAVNSPLGNVLVLAGAGSGKTRVLVSRIAYLIENYNISPHAVLAVTFTNKAAGEMKERLEALLQGPVEGLWVGTFHGICHRLLRRHYNEASLPEHFQILDSDDQLRVIKRVQSEMNLDADMWPPKQTQYFINSKKDEGLRPDKIYANQNSHTHTLLKIYESYEKACQRAGVIDFAEIILRTYELLRKNKSLLEHYQQRFRAILVDEFQDTNAIQYGWIKLLAGDNNCVMAVGDDDQSIYGWRGAQVENINRFREDFQNTLTIRLEQNYRSTANILGAANALISNNTSRMGKELWTTGAKGSPIALYSAFNELEEARFVCDNIQKARQNDIDANNIAILYRSNAQSRVLEEALLRAGVPYKIHGGMRYFERAEIKDAMSYLRLCVSFDNDTAFERIINFPTRGIGGKTVDDIRNLARVDSISLWQAMHKLIESGHFTQRAQNALSSFIELIECMQTNIADLDLEEQVKIIIHDSGLHEHFSKAKDERSQAKVENLEELVSAAREFRYEQSMSEDSLLPMVAFLAHASLEAGEMQADAQESSVNLMTLHAAKGLEFPVVFLVGMEEGVFPSHQSTSDPKRLEEERRLCYVGMTRAMQSLFITYAEIRRQYGREEYHRPSRFIMEIPEEFLNVIRANSIFSRSSIPQGVSNSVQDESGYNIGQNVTHKKFGQGVIMAIEGSGANKRVQVSFAEGMKWLVLSYANLEVV